MQLWSTAPQPPSPPCPWPKSQVKESTILNCLYCGQWPASHSGVQHGQAEDIVVDWLIHAVRELLYKACNLFIFLSCSPSHIGEVANLVNVCAPVFQTQTWPAPWGCSIPHPPHSHWPGSPAFHTSRAITKYDSNVDMADLLMSIGDRVWAEILYCSYFGCEAKVSGWARSLQCPADGQWQGKGDPSLHLQWIRVDLRPGFWNILPDAERLGLDLLRKTREG